MHHSVSDGLSGVLLIRELCHSYSSIMKGGELCLPPLPVQYSDYAVWQRRWLEETGEMATQLAYWKGQLAGTPQLLELPTDKPRPRVQSFKGDCLEFTLERMVVQALKKFAQECGATFFMVMLTLWAALLGRCSRQDKVVVGTPWNGRNKSEVQHLIGYFINPLALCVNVDSALPFFRMVQHVRDVVLAAMEHADAPFHKVVEAVGATGSVSGNPIFQSMIMPDQMVGMTELALGPDACVIPGRRINRHGSSKVDVSLVLCDETQAGNLTLLLEYRTDLWCEASMQRLGQQLVCLASSAVASPEMPVGRLPMMTEAERMQLMESSQLKQWLQVPPSPLSLCALWDCQVATRPADMAARCQEAALSFAQLDSAAGLLSAALAASGVGAEARVAIVMERSLLMLAAMLGVLKAGACYVSLDPANPPAYLASLLDAASIKAILWDRAVCGRLQGMAGLEQTTCFVVDDLVADARTASGTGGRRGRNQDSLADMFSPSRDEAAGSKDDRPSLVLYRTGDCARLLPCGDLALMGRLDHQVKVRGVRLELGFVEQAMARLPGVAAAGAVLVPATQQGLVDAPGHDTLMAVVSPRRLLPEALLAALRQQLPLYALPARILCVDELPRLISGKLDRRKLLAMAAAEMAEMRRVGTGGGGREAPASHAAVRTDPLEAKLAALWGKVLRLPSVSVFDDFFNIGGNSLVAVQLQRELARELARDPALAPLASGSQSLSVFSHRTISSMAAEAAGALGRTAGRGASGASDDGRAFTGAAAAASLIFRPRSLFARLLGPASSSSGAEPATWGEEHAQSGVLEVVTSNLRFLWSFSVVMLHFGHCGGQNLRCFQNTPLAGLWAPHDNTSLANFVPRAFQGGVLGLSILSGMGAASGGMRPSLGTPLLAVMLALLMEFGVSRAFDDLVRSSKQERFSTTAHLWGLWALAFNQLLLWLCVGIWRGHNHREGPRHQKGGVVLLLLAAGTVQFLLPILFALLWPPASAAGVHGMWFGPWGMHQLGWEPLGPRVLTSALPFAIGYAYNSQITRMVHTVRSHVWLRVVLAAIFVQLTVRSTFFLDILSGVDLRSSESARFATIADVMATWELGSWWREWPLRVLGYMGALAEDMGMAFSMLAVMPALDGMVTRFGRASLPIYLFHPHVLRLMEPFSFWLLRQVSSNMPLTVTLEVLLPLSFTVCLCLAFSAMQRRGLGVGKTVLGLSIVLHVLKRALV
eukprot:jgi/Mesvir1/15320/Mv06526-RA.1